jgi:hypothetical protein
MMTAMNILKTTMACLLGLSLAACTAGEATEPADPDSEKATEATKPADPDSEKATEATTVANMTTTKLELGRVP